MISSRKNERGFGALEGILAVIIIVAIVFIGWYVHKHRSTTKPVATTSSQQSSNPTTLPNGSSNSDLQSDLSNITNTSNQSSQDITTTNGSLNDQSTMTSVPQ